MSYQRHFEEAKEEDAKNLWELAYKIQQATGYGTTFYNFTWQQISELKSEKPEVAALIKEFATLYNRIKEELPPHGETAQAMESTERDRYVRFFEGTEVMECTGECEHKDCEFYKEGLEGYENPADPMNPAKCKKGYQYAKVGGPVIKDQTSGREMRVPYSCVSAV